MSSTNFGRLGLKVLGIASAVAVLSATNAAGGDTGLARALHALDYERGRLCMSDHTHFGNGGTYRSETRARKSAIRAWRGFVIAEYGTDWGRYSRAIDKDLECEEVGSRWRCKVEARPCRGR